MHQVEETLEGTRSLSGDLREYLSDVPGIGRSDRNGFGHQEPHKKLSVRCVDCDSLDMLTKTAPIANVGLDGSPEPSRKEGSEAEGPPRAALKAVRLPLTAATTTQKLFLTWRGTAGAAGVSDQVEPFTEAEIRARLCRMQGDLNYREIADRVGMNKETVRRYLRGDSRIPAVFVATIAATFGVDPAEILLKQERGPQISFAEQLGSVIEQLGAIQAQARGTLGV